MTQRNVLIGAGAVLVIVILAFWIGTAVGDRTESVVQPLRAELETLKADLASALDRVETAAGAGDALSQRLDEHAATTAATAEAGQRTADQAASLASRVDDLSGSHEDLGGQVSGLDERLGGLEETAEALRDQAAGLTESVRGRIDAAAQAVAALEARVAALEQRLTEAGAAEAVGGAPAPSATAGDATDAGAADADDLLEEGEPATMGIGGSLWLPDRAGSIVLSSVTESGARVFVDGRPVTLEAGGSARFRLGGRACRLTLEAVEGRKATLAYTCG